MSKNSEKSATPEIDPKAVSASPVEGAAALLAKAPKVLGPKSILYVLRVDTKERAALDIIAAIADFETRGEPATLSGVIALAAETHRAPRSKEFEKDPRKFIRGYVTNDLKPGGTLAIR